MKRLVGLALAVLGAIAVMPDVFGAPPAPPTLRELPASGFPFSHGPGIAFLDGRLLACWYTGAAERSADSRVVCSASADLGETWSAPSLAIPPHPQAPSAAKPALSVGNVALTATGGKLVMLFGAVERGPGAPCRGWHCGRIDAAVSSDGGRSWSGPMRFDDRPGALPRSHPLHFSSVDLSPVYHEADAASIIATDLSTLGAPGRTQTIQPIPGPPGLIQPALATANGRLFAYLRDEKRGHVFVSAWNAGPGKWSRAEPTALHNPASAIEAFTDAHARIVLVLNPGHDRKRLALTVSADGRTFARPCLLVDKGQLGDIAYPAATQAAPDRWVIVASIRNKSKIAALAISQAWIDACAPPGSVR